MNTFAATRHQARIMAFQVLYALSFAKVDTKRELRACFRSYPACEEEENRQPAQEANADFAWRLVEGVWAHQNEVDQHISRFSQHWSLQRMGHVERTVLRLALYELLFCPETPPKVVINEALELCSAFAEKEANKFINGILDAAMKEQQKTRKTAQHKP